MRASARFCEHARASSSIRRQLGSSRVMTRRVPTYAALVSVVIALLLAAAATAAPGGGTRIGFWAGETIPGTDYSSPGTYWKPRNTQMYTPHLWRILSSERIPLYFNLRFHRDFGSIPK